MSLSPIERDVLDFETCFPQARARDGTRERTIRELLDLTTTRYAQTLVHLLERQDAWAYAPATMKRLQRQVTRRTGPSSRTPS